MEKRVWVLFLVAMALLVISLVGCSLVTSEEADTPWIAALTYHDAEQVWVSRPYEAGHQGIDISTTQVIDLFSPGEGTFMKEMYYHPGVPRWQVNAEIRQGKYAIELLLEPGDSVSEAEAQRQYDLLIPDGTRVKAGDLLGQRIIASGQPYCILHLAVRENSTGTFFCPMDFMAEEAVAGLLDLFQRDHPGQEICTLEE